MDDDPEDVAEESGEWAHPSPTPPVSDPDDIERLDPPAVASTDIDTEPTDAMPEPPRLPDALFAETPADDDRCVHWYVREDAAVLVMANAPLDRDHCRAVAATPLVETADGEFEWEIPPELVRGHPEAVDVPEAALIQPGRSIHFRASTAMLDGPVRTCYAMTTDRLEALTG
ncbi:MULTISPECIES: hypothetical protein [Salinibaculum]|uniref:hypothetical protein n=1 Tax=Salinibaculum TaxID=2732368 RepID=UPI0030CE6CAA